MAKTILIAGSSSGLGRATAKHLHAKGWNVVAAMRNPEREEELIRLVIVNISSGGGRVTLPLGTLRPSKRFLRSAGSAATQTRIDGGSVSTTSPTRRSSVARSKPGRMRATRRDRYPALRRRSRWRWSGACATDGHASSHPQHRDRRSSCLPPGLRVAGRDPGLEQVWRVMQE
ncbi:SDR family NAD(P)-dependent oxidoreductase [Sorangium sp. So ce1182]|uniref:SDR family NAD(P)-dependent oxidoreductase n=1 Tax=Sorangium sp. So ce1182 TaxID=3133334 RepID=UPI003F617957